MQRKSLYISAFFSILFLFVNIFMLPNIGMPKADPFFHITITPATYWIGFLFTIILTLILVFSYEKIKIDYKLGLLLLLVLSTYVYILPKLFYINSIYTDTYIFVAEMVNIINSGHIGVGHSLETPGLALVSSQFKLITGIDHIIVTNLFQFFISLMTIIIIYIISKFFTNEKTAILSCFFFISINWMGFYFNRQSYSLMFQIFIYYFIYKYYFMRGDHIQASLIMIMLSFISLVISHPLSSLLISASLMMLFFFINMYKYVEKRFLHNKINELDLSLKISSKSFYLSTIFFVIWFIWNIYTYRNYDLLIRTVLTTISELIGQPNPSVPAQTFITGYQKTYSPIVILRLSAFIYETIVASFLGIFSIFKMKNSNKSIILCSWFAGSMSMFPAGLYTGHFFNRTFLHAIPIFSILLSWYVFLNPPLSFSRRIMKNSLHNYIKLSLLLINVIFIILIPLSMYSVSPFFYPPTSYLEEADYLTQYGIGHVSVIPGDSVLGYYTLVNNASDIIIKFPPGEAEVIATNFRTFTRGAFLVERTDNIERINYMEKGYINSTFYYKIYDSNIWHRVYYKYNGVR